jgi:uncharacterized protein (TIGR00255 family)
LFEVLSRREVLGPCEESEGGKEERGALLKATEDAIAALLRMREAEGAKIARDVLARLKVLDGIRGRILAITERTAAAVRSRLIDRLSRVSGDINIDQNRVASEVVFLVDRADVTEELVRLASHLEQFQETLGKPPNGRKLDFIVQEMGREINTIGSKAQDAEIQRLVVDAKVELEKIREQLQNVE